MAQICTVTGHIVTALGRPLARVAVSLRPDQEVNAGAWDDEDRAVARAPVAEYTDAQGRFSIGLPQGQKMIVHVAELGLHKQVVVPTKAQATFRELVDGQL